MYDANVQSPKRLSLLYNEVTRHYVISILTGTMAKPYVWPACNKGCKRDATCEHSCCDCTSIPPCALEEGGVRYPCDDCNRHFRSGACFDRHKINNNPAHITIVYSLKCSWNWLSSRIPAPPSRFTPVVSNNCQTKGSILRPFLYDV